MNDITKARGQVIRSAIRIQEPGSITVRSPDGIEHDAVVFDRVRFVAKCQLIDAYESMETMDDMYKDLMKYDVPRAEPVTCVRCLGDDGPRP